jgi:RHS repeat-associated protein
MEKAMSKAKALAVSASLVLLPALAAGQQVEYYHLDALGSVRAVTDASGEVVARHDYEPFGVEWEGEPSADTRRFTGKERDSESGWDYFGARYYASPIGRFTSVDPVYTWRENLSDPERWNRYAYGRNNPVTNVDPDGKIAVPAILLGAWAVYEVGSQIYDAYTLGATLTDPNATTGDKALAAVGFGIGVIAPGGGYGTAGKAAAGKVDDLADAAKALDNAAAGGRTLKVGPHAGESIPARGPQRDFTAAERAEMNRIGAETGCHTCGTTVAGTRSGNFVPDHQPPSKINKGGASQELRPHCIGCSRTQGGEVTKALREEKK